MLVCKWEKLPVAMQTDAVKPYYQALRKRNFSLLLKRIFDIVVSFIMLLLLLPLFIILAIAIKLDSRGPVFYRQVRYTQYGKEFRIHKFRSMTVGADKGSLVTVKNDNRITKVGKIIRKLKLDEISQLIDVFEGKMTFVGCRPEVKKYIDAYSEEMTATFLLPAGITSMASLLYKDENDLIDASDDPDKVYIEKILPEKMVYNLQELKKAGVCHDIKVMFMTFFAVLGKDYAKKTKAGEKKENNEEKRKENG